MNISSNPSTQEICRAHLFEEPLVPIGADPTPAENAALAAALLGYSKRAGPDDFSSLTGFLDNHPGSPWSVALLTNLGLEYFRTGHYASALEAWSRAWEGGKTASDLRGKAVANRAVGELAYMYARLGRMIELGALLQSIEGRAFFGPATERITGAREGLWTMRNRPEIAFRCGPLALQKVTRSLDPINPGTELIRACASTQQGCSLFQIEELSQKLGLSFQMAFGEKGAAIVVPSVVHLKLDHFAAITRQKSDRFLLQDATFGRDVWVTKETLDAEASGYFLIPIKEMSVGWRAVMAHEGQSVWGKGSVDFTDPDPHGPCDPATSGGDACPKEDECKGLAVPRVHLMLISLNINDEPLSYTPPVGPAVRFTVRYNQRDARQPTTFAYSNLGPKWTFDWLSYITDDPSNPDKDVSYYIMGGGTRTFTGFDGASQFAFQQYDQTKLTRTSPNSYEMVSKDGTTKKFEHPDGSIGNSRKIFLTELIDPFGQAVKLIYPDPNPDDPDSNLLRIVAISDAIGQITRLSYIPPPGDVFKIQKVTDPFGRAATFDYDGSGRLIQITDPIGLTSQFKYDVDGTAGSASDVIIKLTTPYGDTSFIRSAPSDKLTRTLETIYPDGDRDRVEYDPHNQPGVDDSDPKLPSGMAVFGDGLASRNTYYWSKKAYASAYPDYTKAKIYHWLHDSNQTVTAGILECVKEPLEGRVWYDYPGQSGFSLRSTTVGNTNKPAHIGRVLDDGTTQLYTYEYNGFGNVTKTVDPVGRTFSYIYADNGIDLLETRQTRPGQNELLSTNIYHGPHPHLIRASTDAAGRGTMYTYNDRGQVRTKTNAKNETTTYNYDPQGYLTSIDGPLPGSSIGFTYDNDTFGQVHTKTDESGYELTFKYDKLDRITEITFPDGTSSEYNHTLLDLTTLKDRAGRQTTFEYNSVRQMTKRTDPLNQVTLFQWCKCGALRGLTDPMSRTTFWRHDIQGRLKSKEYVDGSKVTYRYEDAISRLSQRIDEKLQVTQYEYNKDDTLHRIAYNNSAVPTPAVAFAYDANYNRLSFMKDGTGTTFYNYFPISPPMVTDPPTPPSLGAGQLASVDGPLQNDLIAFAYDELGRRVSTAINSNASTVDYDQAGRVFRAHNALGGFSDFNYKYDGYSNRLRSQTYQTDANDQTTTFTYDKPPNDMLLRNITNTYGGVVISEFDYTPDVKRGRIESWTQNPGLNYFFGYDKADQLKLASVSVSAGIVPPPTSDSLSYTYDLAGNRLTEQIGSATTNFSYNALNELTFADAGADAEATYEWDAEQRLVAVNSGSESTQFTYDGFWRRVGIRKVVDGAEVSNRRFVWCDNEMCEERTPNGAVAKRFFPQGVEIRSGPKTGVYFYTRDHLGSIRELIDSDGALRARYAYDPFGRCTNSGDGEADFEADFGFAGMFWTLEASLNLTLFRAYDPEIGRWLSRDPLDEAEVTEGSNLFSYVLNDPVNRIDRLGLEQGEGEGRTRAEACKKAKENASCPSGVEKCSCWKSGVVDLDKGTYTPGYTCIAPCKKSPPPPTPPVC